MDNDCVNDISNATDGPQKKKRHLSEQHFLPAYTARVARGREIETRPISRVGPTSRPTARYANDNVTFRFAVGAASIYILKQPSTYRTRSQLNPRSPLVNSSTRIISSILKYWQPGAKSIKKNTNSTQNKSETHHAKQYEVTSFLSTDCELSTKTCSKNVYSLGP